MEKTLELSPKIHTPNGGSKSGALFSGVVKRTTQRTHDIQESPLFSNNPDFVNHHAGELNHFLGKILSASSEKEVLEICTQYLHLLSGVFTELHKITYDRSKNEALINLSSIISGNRGGVWEGKKEEAAFDFGQAHLFVETVRARMEKDYSEEIRQTCREILDISDLIVLYFLRFVRTESSRIEDKKNITIQEIISAEQFMLSRRITHEEILMFLRETEKLMNRAPEKIQEKYGKTYRNSLLYPDGSPLNTPDIGKLKEIIEHMGIFATDTNFRDDVKKFSDSISTILEECKPRLLHQMTIDQIKNSVVGFYNGITLYRERQEVEKGLRSTPTDSPFCAERGLENLNVEIEKNIFELIATGYAILGGVPQEKKTHQNANVAHLQNNIIFARAYISRLLKKCQTLLEGGTDLDTKPAIVQFNEDLLLYKDIQEVEGWFSWMTDAQNTSPDKPIFSEDLKKGVIELMRMKNSIPKETVNRFIKLASQKMELVWDNPVLSNVFHDIILFASSIDMLTDSTTISLLLMIKKTIPQNDEGVAYIQSILRSVLRSQVALQPRSLTKNNIMTIARDWSIYCGKNYMLYLDLCEWLSKNYIIHGDAESRLIGEFIIKTIRSIDPPKTRETQDTSRITGRVEGLGALFENGRDMFKHEPIHLIMEKISTFLLFGQFEIKELRPEKQSHEDFLGGTSEDEYFPEITSPYYVYYDDKLAFQFTPSSQANQSIDGLFGQIYWFIVRSIENHKKPATLTKPPIIKK